MLFVSNKLNFCLARFLVISTHLRVLRAYLEMLRAEQELILCFSALDLLVTTFL